MACSEDSHWATAAPGTPGSRAGAAEPRDRAARRGIEAMRARSRSSPPPLSCSPLPSIQESIPHVFLVEHPLLLGPATTPMPQRRLPRFSFSFSAHPVPIGALCRSVVLRGPLRGGSQPTSPKPESAEEAAPGTNLRWPP